MTEKTDAELIEEAEKLLKSLPSLPYAHDDHIVNPGDSPGEFHVFSLGDFNDGPPFLTVLEYCKDEAIALTSCVPIVEELASRLKAANGRLGAANDVKDAQKIVLEHLEKELKSANALLDERLKQVTVMHGELREAKEKGQLALQACEFLGVPLNVGLLSKRPLTEMEKQGALKYERKARELMAPSPAFCTCVGPTVANTASMCGRCGKRRFAAPTITSTSNPDDGGK